ncbi:GNAT family N-acetyltransferase [Stratiformator vulcanicus]|uniref:Amino-acid acetyltransferase n=1 Tax=Stratiformator vulcanicus TaxID=2527980 RepID=A0A517R5S7_9PLAN|nr:GNAT family N-acetyltransferase [Stratiformator vulcanicus]QDT39222.1 Amino-acid acetyltransferase [Stratiformator vulcanicus]
MSSHSSRQDAIEFDVRQATAADIASIHAFLRPFVAGGRLLERTMEELDQLVGTGFVAETEDRIVGFAALEVYSRKLAEIRSLAVSAELRGLGVGKRLVAHCVDLARDRQILEVMAITSSEEFFRGCGFDFTLPGEKKAVFHQTRGHSEVPESSSAVDPDEGRD